MVLGLIRSQFRYRRHHTKSIRRQKNHPGGMTLFRNRLYNVINVIDWIGYPGVLGFGSVIVIHFSIRGDNYILKQGVPFNGTKNVRFTLLTQINGLGITPAFKVEDTIVVPSMLVITDKCAFGICGKCGFPGSGKSEENSCISILPHIGRAMHRSNSLQRKVVIHYGEDPFFHLTSIPGTSNDGHSFSKIEKYKHL